MQRVLTILIAAAIIYIVVDAKQAIMPPSPPAKEQQAHDPLDPTIPRPEIEGGFIEKSISKVLINVIKSPEGRSFLEKVVRPADQSITGDYTQKVNNNSITTELFRIEKTTDGTGPKVSCGHTVTVQYEILNMQRVIVESGTKTFVLGAHDIVPALSNVIVGMQKGESRRAMAPKLFAYDSPNFTGQQPPFPTDHYQIKVHLIDIHSENFIDDKVKIFDDELAYIVPYLCGDSATFDAKIMRINGEVIYNSHDTHQRITMNIGDNLYPMIFSHALFNKTPFGTRSVICTGQHLQKLSKYGSIKLFKNPPQMNHNEFFLIELNNFKREGKPKNQENE